MSLTNTTLSAAVSASDTSFALASVTGITAPVSTTGSGYTYLLVGTEMMFVETVNTSTNVVTVLRGQLGSRSVAHGASEPVTAGLPSDFSGYRPTVNDVQVAPDAFRGVTAPVVAAATITATGSIFHLTGTVQLTTLVPYSGYVEGGPITIIFDGSGSGLTWTTGGTSPNAFSVAGTATTAASAVTFFRDLSIPGWVPSRLA